MTNMILVTDTLLLELERLAKRDPKNKLRQYQGRIECITCGGLDVPWHDTNGHDGHIFAYLDEDMWN